VTSVHRWVRFASLDGRFQYGRLDGKEVIPVAGAPWTQDGNRETGSPLDVAQLKLGVPTEPSKIVLVGVNYRQHAVEMGKGVPDEPLIFMKPVSALNPSGAPIQLPPDSKEVHYEAELGLVVGKRLKNATPTEAAGAVFGLCPFNDVTARDIQRREVQFTRAKSYDTFACVGPWLTTGVDPGDLPIFCRINGEVRQSSRTSDMVFDVPHLLAFISRIMTLHPGDLVSTGTPSGVGALHVGDRVEVEIEGIGTLVNPVVMGE
jgi:2-keto-4-pentenoate hydratase/2-oxohepta-3-ene-1,7-dioic acid hydratase in catechol pathway